MRRRSHSSGGLTGRFARLARWLTWAYVLLIAAVFVLVTQLGDRWWPATILMFGPRWVWLAPAALLLPWVALQQQWQSAAWVLAAALVVAGPIMGWQWSFTPSAAARRDLRVITFNIGNSYRAAESRVDLEQIRRLFDITRADVLALQECPYDREQMFPYFPELQTHSAAGSCVISRFPILRTDTRKREDLRSMGGSGLIDRLELQTAKGPISLMNLHLETPRDGLERVVARSFYAAAALERNLAVRRLESAAALAWATRARMPLIVLGDFNMPVESAVYQRYWSNLGNAFNDCGRGYGLSKFEKRFGIRIDHVLYDTVWECVAATVDETQGGDHRPLIVDLRLR
jgi:endonuclease/exonuclease/phosphatase (EEP) superfamily protein YafD